MFAARAPVVLVAFAVSALGGTPVPSPPATPRAVVEAYCASDFAGDQTSSETWPRFVRYAAWPDAPGWDTFSIVAGYTVAPAKGSTVRVTYHVLGVLEGETAREDLRDQVVDYRLVRRGGRWKVAAPQLEPHVSADVALRLLDGLDHNELVEADHDTVRASRELVTKLAASSEKP